MLKHLTEHELEAGGKPSTWFPPEGLVELIDSDAHVVINWSDFQGLHLVTPFRKPAKT